MNIIMKIIALLKKMKADNTVESSTTGTIQTYTVAPNFSVKGYKTDDIKVKR